MLVQLCACVYFFCLCAFGHIFCIAHMYSVCVCVMACVWVSVNVCERDFEIPGFVDTSVCLALGFQTVSARAV